MVHRLTTRVVMHVTASCRLSRWLPTTCFKYVGSVAFTQSAMCKNCYQERWWLVFKECAL